MKLLRTVALSSALAMASTGVYAALDKTGADWVATVAENYTDAGPASDSLSMVDFLLCIMENSNSGTHVNQTYGSMIDENICNGKSADEPAFASQVMTTSRASNTEPYKMKSWFTTGEGDFIVVDASITSAPTDAVPRGVASLTWNMVDKDGVGTGKNKGMLVLTDGELDNVKYIESAQSHLDSSKMLTTYIHGTIDGNGTSGKLRVQTQNYDYANNLVTPSVYEYVFNANNVHYKTASTATCLDRTPANMTKRVYGYKLFTEAGALVKLAGPFDFTYVDPQDGTTVHRGWADTQGAWLQGGEDDSVANKTRPTTITRSSNSKPYNVCWDDDDDLNGGTSSCGTASDGIRYQLTHASEGVLAFDAPILMVAADITDTISNPNATVTAAIAWANQPSGRQFAKYRGGATSFDFPWQCLVGSTWTDNTGNNCAGSQEWSPEYALEDGFEFQQQGTLTKYYAKAVATKSTPALAANGTDCDSLVLSTAPAVLGSYAIPDITGTVIWGIAGAGVPSVANGGLTEALKLAVIHGVEQ
jgi:hypothetical protein